jgi:hypothetical protein
MRPSALGQKRTLTICLAGLVLRTSSYPLPLPGVNCLTSSSSRPLSRQAINITITWFVSVRFVLNVTVEILCTRRKFAIFIGSGLLQLIHHTTQLRLFRPVGTATDQHPDRICFRFRHQHFQFPLTATGSLRRLGKLRAVVENVPVRLDEEAVNTVIGDSTAGKCRGNDCIQEYHATGYCHSTIAGFCTSPPQKVIHFARCVRHRDMGRLFLRSRAHAGPRID